MKRIIYIGIVISLFGSMLITSCNHPKLGYRLEQIDSLTILLDKTELMLSEINDDSIKAMMTDAHLKNEILASISKEQLSPKEHSDYLQLDSAEKQFVNYISVNNKNVEEFTNSRKQISDLKEKLEKHTIKGKKFDEYYQTESTSVNNLFKAVSTSLDNVKLSIEKYKLINPEITKLFADKKIKINKEVSDKTANKNN